MNNSPIITMALIESRHRDMIAAARNARLAQEARQANRAARKVAAEPRQAAKRRWRLALIALSGLR